MPHPQAWFIPFFWICIAILAWLLLEIRDRRGKLSLRWLLALVTLVTIFFAGLSIAKQQADRRLNAPRPPSIIRLLNNPSTTDATPNQKS
jgi:hypothetical protein